MQGCRRQPPIAHLVTSHTPSCVLISWVKSSEVSRRSVDLSTNCPHSAQHKHHLNLTYMKEHAVMKSSITQRLETHSHVWVDPSEGMAGVRERRVLSAILWRLAECTCISWCNGWERWWVKARLFKRHTCTLLADSLLAVCLYRESSGFAIDQPGLRARGVEEVCMKGGRWGPLCRKAHIDVLSETLRPPGAGLGSGRRICARFVERWGPHGRGSKLWWCLLCALCCFWVWAMACLGLPLWARTCTRATKMQWVPVTFTRIAAHRCRLAPSRIFRSRTSRSPCASGGLRTRWTQSTLPSTTRRMSWCGRCLTRIPGPSTIRLTRTVRIAG